jgi:hypothetical protein
MHYQQQPKPLIFNLVVHTINVLSIFLHLGCIELELECLITNAAATKIGIQPTLATFYIYLVIVSFCQMYLIISRSEAPAQTQLEGHPCQTEPSPGPIVIDHPL